VRKDQTQKPYGDNIRARHDIGKDRQEMTVQKKRPKHDDRQR
jgi:hypothetical protein